MDDFNSHSGKPYQLSCSLGIVIYDASMPPNLDQLLRHADEEMYSCKVKR
ncbi:diguanylate cyclase domain-containing protein [Aeromonas veronii]